MKSVKLVTLCKQTFITLATQVKTNNLSKWEHLLLLLTRKIRKSSKRTKREKKKKMACNKQVTMVKETKIQMKTMTLMKI